MRKIVIATVAMAVLAGCYHTKTGTTAPRGGVTHEDRQWFALWGGIPLSGTAGSECGAAGMAYSDSRKSGMDILIDIGLSIGAFAAAGSICNLPDRPTAEQSSAYSTCMLGVTGLSALLGTRTVTYACNEAKP